MLSLYAEQLAGKKDLQPVKANTDVYSVGVLLLEVIQPSLIHYLNKGQESQMEKYKKLRDISPYRLPIEGVFSKDFRSFMARILEPDEKKRPSSSDVRQLKWLAQESPIEPGVYLTEVADLCSMKVEENEDESGLTEEEQKLFADF